jgi:hypothetical protein
MMILKWILSVMIECKDVNWAELSSNTAQKQAAVVMVFNLWIP